MLEVISRNAGTRIVINTKSSKPAQPAQNSTGCFSKACANKIEELVVVRVIDRKREGLDLLASYLDTEPSSARSFRGLYFHGFKGLAMPMTGPRPLRHKPQPHVRTLSHREQ